MKTKHISVVSLSALLFLAPGFLAAGEDMAASSIDVESGETSTATYDDYEDWELARDFRPYINLRANHKCMPLTFKETYGDFNTSHGDSYSGRDLSDLQDFCRDSFSSDFVVVANVVRDSTRSESFRITYGIAFGKQYSHLQDVSDTVEDSLFDLVDLGALEDALGTHGKDAQYIVVDVVDGELTSVWADLHQGNYVFPKDWLTMTGNHVHLYAGKYYNSLKLDDLTVSSREVVCDDEYTGSLDCDVAKFLETLGVEEALDYYMNFGDPTGSDHGGYGKLVMAETACEEASSYTSEVDGAIYSGDSLTALQGYIGCYGEGTSDVWSGSYMMQKSCYTDPYLLKGCKSGNLDGGDVCNASIDAPANTWTTSLGTNVYMEPDVAGRPRLYSPNGIGFNDMLLQGGTRPASITIRTASRVNMVSTTYTDSTTRSHGVSSGTVLTLTGLADDPVVSVTMCDGKIGSDERVGFVRLITASGRTVVGGEGNLNCETIAPSGKQLYGFYGRTGSELDVLGTYWGTRVATPSVSNVSLTISGTTATGAYTFYDQYGLAESSSTYKWMRASNTSEAGTTISGQGNLIYALDILDHQKYLRFCVTPSNGYKSGSQVCSSWVYVGNVIPTVSNVSLTVSGNQAVGSYTLSGVADSYTYEWWRTSDTSQTGSIINETAATYTLKGLDNDKHLRFCVTPNLGTYSGTKSCSGWISVGHLVSFFADPGFAGEYIHVAYEKSILGTCFNMSTFSFNDKTSSVKFRAPTAQNATLKLFKGANCSGGTKVLTASAGSTESVDSFFTFNDLQYDNEISSFLVTP